MRRVATRRQLSRCGDGIRRGRENDLEHRTVVISRADAAAVPLDDRLDDRQPETAAARCLACRVNLVEALEDQWQVLLRYSWSGITNAQHRAVRHHGTTQDDLATLGCVSQCVRGQVLQRLLEPIRVADD